MTKTRISLALFLFLFSAYLFTYSPRFHSSDGLAMFSLSESLARRGEWDIDQIRWMGLQQGTFGLDGHLYSRKGAGVSLLALPLTWLGLVVPTWGTATAALLFNALVTAGTGALLLRYLRILGYDDQTALVAALTFGLATLAWPYAKTFFSDPLAGLCLLAAALALLRFRSTGRVASVFWAGLALSVAVATRYANGIVIPLYALLLIKYQVSNVKCQISNRKPQTLSLQSPISNRQSLISNLKSLISNLRLWIAFATPLAITGTAILLYNLARYGNALNTGYLPQESFSGIWWQGIVGLLISPGRGLFLYAPILLLALPAAPTFFRRHRVEATLAGAIILTHLLLYGKWFMWHGGFAWGPRFMIPTLPFFAMALAPAIEWTKNSTWWRRGFLALVVFSGLIQILGLSVHFELFQSRLLETGLPLFAPITFFATRYSPLIGQLQFLTPSNLDFAWIVEGRLDWPLLATLLAAVVVSGFGLLQANTKSEGDSRLRYHPIIILVVLGATIWLLVRAHNLPYGDDLRDAVAILNNETTSADLIITSTPAETVPFADLYQGRADVLGLLPGGPALDSETISTLNRITKSHPRVWWLPNWLPPQQSGVNLWLMQNGFRAQDLSSGTRRLALYYFPSPPLTEKAIEVTFAEAITLDRVDARYTVQAGDILPVALHWRAERAVSVDYHVFVHLLDAGGNRVAQSDGQPALWTRPTSSWSPAEPIEDRHALLLPSDLPAGEYTLITGLYLPASGERLAVSNGETFANIGPVHISDPAN